MPAFSTARLRNFRGTVSCRWWRQSRPVTGWLLNVDDENRKAHASLRNAPGYLRDSATGSEQPTADSLSSCCCATAHSITPFNAGTAEFASKVCRSLRPLPSNTVIESRCRSTSKAPLINSVMAQRSLSRALARRSAKVKGGFSLTSVATTARERERPALRGFALFRLTALRSFERQPALLPERALPNEIRQSLSYHRINQRCLNTKPKTFAYSKTAAIKQFDNEPIPTIKIGENGRNFFWR